MHVSYVRKVIFSHTVPPASFNSIRTLIGDVGSGGRSSSRAVET